MSRDSGVVEVGVTDRRKIQVTLGNGRHKATFQMPKEEAKELAHALLRAYTIAATAEHEAQRKL